MLRFLFFPLLLARLASADFDASLKAVEGKLHGRIGVAVIDTGSGRVLEHRGGERFLLCSTFKLLLVGQVLDRVAHGKETLERKLPIAQKDLLPYSPFSRGKVGERELAVKELCAAAVGRSDNTAANLLLRASGGPGVLTAFLRSLGDDVTRVDRYEPALNDPEGAMDTTSPKAMAATVRALVLGDALNPAAREQLKDWLFASDTGRKRLMAGLPSGWKIAEKTGSGSGNATNDVGVIFPPGRAPLVVAAFVAGAPGKRSASEAALAEVARLVVREFGTPGGLK
jgi:beta-lactamase class A